MKRTTTFIVNLCVILFAISSLPLLAQRVQKAPHEFSVYADGGISTYCFQPSTKGVLFAEFRSTNKPGFKINSSVGFSSELGFGFTGFLSRQVGIHTGVGFGMLNVKSKANLYSITPSYTGTGYPCDLHIKLMGYTEIHRTMFVTIPVMLQFQTRQKQYWNLSKSQKAGFYAQGGVKLHFLFNNKYAAGVDTLFRAAYFPELDNWAATQKFAGLGKMDGNKTDGSLDFGTMALFACEAGVKWRIDNNIFVYTGVFFDCALNDPLKKDNRKSYESYINLQDFEELTLLKFSERINLMVVGIRIRAAFTKYQRF
ncbi:MAG: hypothetical protein FWF70_00190 [Bacteroidetes bacterium]|nr:hypothetical protein [Bacteroidota bacterium]MCL1969715.1 hypothetical protein [Bacteroidota bacterium]